MNNHTANVMLRLLDDLLMTYPGGEPPKEFSMLRREILRQRENDQPVVKERDLPDAKPVPGRPIKYRSVDMPCPTCKAKPGQPCFEMSNRGPGAKPTTNIRDTGYHKPRTRAAQEATARFSDR